MTNSFSHFIVAAAILFGCLAPQSRAERTTWLMIDVTQRMGVPNCDGGDCVNGHNNSSKIFLKDLLPGTPRRYRGAGGPDYIANGYWHIVVNCIKTEGPSDGPGSTGSIRVCPKGVPDNGGAYHLFSGTGTCQKCTKNWYEGKATHYWRKFSDWSDYNKFGFKDEYWDREIGQWAFGPVKSQQEADAKPVYSCVSHIHPPRTCMTPVTYRARVWITLDKAFVPTMGEDDPVGVQPGTTAVASIASIPRRSAPGRPRLTVGITGTSPTARVIPYDIRGRMVTRATSAQPRRAMQLTYWGMARSSASAE